MGDGEKAPLRLQFNPKVRLEFHGSTITSDAGLLAFRELDDALDLTGIASNYLQESRTGRNILHHLVPLLRQSIYSRLAGYDDTNDAVRLSKDPAMRVVVACSGSDHNAASTSEMGRFETETLTEEKNLKGLAQMNSQWVEGAMVHTPHRRVILDMDSSESPVHGQQEGAAYNGHFECVCYHPLFLFNQFGDCEAATLRPGNVHSADDWQELLEPVVKGYRKKGLRLLFRGDAAFGKPEVYEYLEQETIGYTIRLSANAVLQREIAHLLVRPTEWPSQKPIVSYHDFAYRAQSWNVSRRVVAKMEWHQGELFPRIGFIVTNLSYPAFKHCIFIGRQIDYSVGDDHIDRVIRDRQLLSEALLEFHLCQARALGGLPGPFQHGVRHVYANYLARGTYKIPGDEAVEAATGADVQHCLAWGDLAH